MKWKNYWLNVRYHVFVGITLIGCVVPWITPRHFPTHSIPIRTEYETVQSEAFGSERAQIQSSPEVWNGQMEVLQNAC